MSDLTKLNSNLSGTITGLSEKDILREYLEVPIGKDGLARDENGFNSIVWQILNWEPSKWI